MTNYLALLTLIGGVRAHVPYRFSPQYLAIFELLRAGQDELRANELMCQRLAHGHIKEPMMDLSQIPGIGGQKWLQVGAVSYVPVSISTLTLRYMQDLKYSARQCFHNAMVKGQMEDGRQLGANPFVVWSGLVRNLFNEGVTDHMMLASAGEWETDTILMIDGEHQAEQMAGMIFDAWDQVVKVQRDAQAHAKYPDATDVEVKNVK